jgi:alanine dehydrogenase
MSALIKKILDGFTNMNSTESSGEKETKMINLKSNIKEFDEENAALIQASAILESISNDPGVTTNEFLAKLINSEDLVDLAADAGLVRRLTLAAVSIETMMSLEVQDDEFNEPTVH